MNEKKLKIAFKKIKLDMDFLKNELNQIKNNKTKNQIKQETFSKKDFEKKIQEFESQILAKINTEFAELKFQITGDIIKLEKELKSIKKNKANESEIEIIDNKIQNSLKNFSEIIEEKITLEINSIKVEFTDEIAKIYDKFFSEIIDFKDKIIKLDTETKNIQKNTTKTNLKITEQNKKEEEKPKKQNKKEEEEENEFYKSSTIEKVVFEENENKNSNKKSRLKKMAKWLFIDEENEENEISDIKKQIKKNKK